MSGRAVVMGQVRSPLGRPALDANSPGKIEIRRALWSSYFHRFYGPHTQHVPGTFLPISLDQALDDLQAASSGQSPDTSPPTGDVLRRCVSQMLLCGHRPDDRFNRLMAESAGLKCDAGAEGAKKERQRAMDLLVSWGEREFDLPGAAQRRTASIEDDLRDAAPTQRAITLPTQIVHRGDAYTVEKQGYFRRELSNVAPLVNPVNWVKLGEFFRKTVRVSPTPGPAADDAPWHGVLGEEFIVNWNGITPYRFDQMLKVDYSVTPEVVRADYSLMYEKDDKIALNEGFFTARTVAGSQGWVDVTMSKTVRFTSSILNLLAPAILAMFLDSKVGGFKQLIETEVD